MKLQHLLLILVLCASCGTAVDNYSIDIRCPECPSAQVRLWRFTGIGIEPVATTKMERGHAVFYGSVNEPVLMYIFVDGATDYLPVFVENTDIDIDYAYHRPSRSTVAGSQCQKKFSDFLQSYSAYSDKGTGIEKMIENATDNDDTLMLNGLAVNYEVLKREETEFQTQYVLQNLSSPVAAYILCANLMYSLSSERLDSLIKVFPNEIKGHIYVKCADNYLKTMLKDSTAL